MRWENVIGSCDKLLVSLSHTMVVPFRGVIILLPVLKFHRSRVDASTPNHPQQIQNHLNFVAFNVLLRKTWATKIVVCCYLYLNLCRQK